MMLCVLYFKRERSEGKKTIKLFSIFNVSFVSSFRLVEKMKHSEDMDLKRVLFSLKTFFQSDKDLVYEFVKEGGLLLLIGKKMPLKNRTGSDCNFQFHEKNT